MTSKTNFALGVAGIGAVLVFGWWLLVDPEQQQGRKLDKYIATRRAELAKRFPQRRLQPKMRVA